MEVMIAVQSGTFLRALFVLLKRRDSARRGGDYYEVLHRPRGAEIRRSPGRNAQQSESWKSKELLLPRAHILRIFLHP